MRAPRSEFYAALLSHSLFWNKTFTADGPYTAMELDLPDHGIDAVRLPACVTTAFAAAPQLRLPCRCIGTDSQQHQSLTAASLQRNR